MKHSRLVLVVALAAVLLGASAATAQERPNILVIWGDDIGYARSSVQF